MIGTDRYKLKKHKPRAGNNLPLRSTEGSLLLRTFVNICFLKATKQNKTKNLLQGSHCCQQSFSPCQK